MRRSIMVLAMLALFAAPTSAHAGFGIVPGSLEVSARNIDGTIDTQAGSHPFAFTVSFKLNTTGSGEVQGGAARDLIVDLPPGLVGDPQAVPQCSRQQFEGVFTKCPPDSQIGMLEVTIPGLGFVPLPVYNMSPSPGVAAQLGMSATSLNAIQDASVRTEQGYGIEVGAFNVPTEVSVVTETIWGVPAEAVHDSQRGIQPPNSSSAPHLPFLTLPTSCQGTPEITLRTDSSLTPNLFVEESAPFRDGAGNPTALGGCDAVPFSPKIAVQPTTKLAENPSGLGFDLKLPDDGLLLPAATAETEPRKVVVALPEGVTANPSLAAGVGVCSEAQYKSEQVITPPGAGCPEDSKLGSIIARSPLLEEPIEGALYLATPYQNPFHSLVALYVVASVPARGVLIKQAGKVDFNQRTGQLTTTFDSLPPLPYSDFKLSFREGPRAPLVTPPECGEFQTVTRMTPFSAAGDAEAVTTQAPFQVERGSEGGACPAGGRSPFAPDLIAGTVNNAGGSFSTMYLRIGRKDGEQEITGFAMQLPPGLTGDLSGIPLCGEAEIQRAREQNGAEAEASPACPAASQIGHTIAEAGVGTVLAQTPGRLYLAGSFEGAPFSVVDITSARVGPFDLGTVVVHLPLRIDPVTAQVSIPPGPADQIPHIIDGIVIHLRTIRVYIDRERFILNPTSCEPTSIGASVIGAGANVASPTDDVAAPVGSRFQAANCASLAFKPSFKVVTSGKTSRKYGASLAVKLTYPKDALGKDANIRSVKVSLPRQLPSRLETLRQACTAEQFSANPAGCPAASRVGVAKAVTPVLPVPLEGPAYFVSYGGSKFPELVVVLQGYGITIDLHGETFISKGITSSTFKTVPDQPVTSFELTLPQGPDSALAANGNLCKLTKTVLARHKVRVRSKGHVRTITRVTRRHVPVSLTMPTTFTGQNGTLVKRGTPIEVTGCRKAKKGKSVRRHKH